MSWSVECELNSEEQRGREERAKRKGICVTFVVAPQGPVVVPPQLFAPIGQSHELASLPSESLRGKGGNLPR